MRQSRVLFAVIVLCGANLGWSSHESVTVLLGQLNSEKKQERLQAIQTLGERGAAAIVAVPQLLRILDDNDLAMRHEAVIALGKIGQEPEQVVPAMIRILSDKSSLLRHSAIDCLREFKADSESAIPQLDVQLHDKEQIVRIAAARALTSIAPNHVDRTAESIRVLMAGLDSDESTLAVESARGIVEIGSPAVPDVVKLLASQRPLTVIHACDTLGAMGARASASIEGVIQALIIATSSSDIDVRWHAIDALGAIGSHPTLVLPVLMEQLNDTSPKIRSHAALTLGHFGKAAASTIPELTLKLKDPECVVRESAASSLGRLGSVASSAVPQLIIALHDKEGSVTIHAAEALGKIGKQSVRSLIQKLSDPSYQLLATVVLAEIGPDAVEAVPALTNLIERTDPDISREALLAIGAIGPGAKAASSQVIQQLENAKSPNRAAAAFALGKIKASEAASVLTSVLEANDDPILQFSASAALLALDHGDASLRLALPEISNALANQQPTIRIEAALTLRRLGLLAKPAVPALGRALKDENADVRVEVMLALAAIGPDSRGAVSDILSQLNDSDPEIREVACHTLGRIGPVANEAVPILERLARSRIRHERTDAAWALAMIAPNSETIQTALPLVIDVLDSAEPTIIRADAAAALGQFGNRSPEALRALQSALKDSDEAVRHAAFESLDKLK